MADARGLNPRWRIPEDVMRRHYLSEGLSIQDLSRRYRMDRLTVRDLLDEYGIRVRATRWPVREVERYEELPYRTTLTGKVLTKTVAILVCGHKQKVWGKSPKVAPHETEYRPKMGCHACGVIEQKEFAADGGEEQQESQRPDDGRGGDSGAVEGADQAGQP